MTSLFCAKLPMLFVPLLVFAWCLPATASDSDGAGAGAPQAPDPMLGKKAGQVRDDNGLKMKLVWCPPGLLTMEQVEFITEIASKKNGKPNDDDDVDPNDEPEPTPRRTLRITPVKVLVTRGYWLGMYEVTQSEWKQVMATEPWKGRDGTKEGDDFPATFVSWEDAMKFCRKLTERERESGRVPDGWEYTLPTDAQWERACRARTETKFSFGDDESKLSEYAWFDGNATNAGEGYAHQVGRKKPNPWGLHDMHGNVWEWCRDFHAEKLPGGRDPETTAGASTRVTRGGSWRHGGSNCRSANRARASPDYGNGDIGFRVARSSVQPVK